MKKYFLILFCAAIHQWATAQVGIGTTAPHSSAVLDLTSTNKGFLPPRMTALQRKAIASPAAGLIVFDTDNNQLFLFDGSLWLPLNVGSASNSLTPGQSSQPAAEQKSSGYFGVNVDISGNYAVIGCTNADFGTTTLSVGAVYVFKKSATGGWVQTAELFASDPQTGSYFGSAVSISGNYIAIGAPLFTPSGVTNAGKIYVFVKGGDETWTQQASFLRPTGAISADYFGYNISIGSTSVFGPALVAGTPYADLGGTNRGAAYTYRLISGNWTFQQTLQPSDLAISDIFGYDVRIDDDYIAIGAPNQTNTAYSYASAGAVYVFVYGGGTWSQQAKLSGTTASAQFGFSLDLKGSLLLVGAPFATPYSNTTASAYLYQRSGSAWGYVNSFYLNNTQGFDNTNRVGVAVALDGNNIIVSAPAGYLAHSGGSSYYVGKAGFAFIYKKNAAGSYYLSKMINDNEALPPSTSNMFGNAIGIENGNYIIGIPYKMVNGIANAGSVIFGYVE